MCEAGTSPATLTSEALWFMVPQIERDVLAHYGDASVRREALRKLMESDGFSTMTGRFAPVRPRAASAS
jgi:hypothetical protein